VRQNDWRRYVAPAAFLLAVTIAIVLIRVGMEAGGSNPTTPTTAKVSHRPKPARRFWTVQAGDTFAVISSQTGVPVRTLARLNPKSSPTSLHIGQRVRLR
jgi:LysM repeat protein